MRGHDHLVIFWDVWERTSVQAREDVVDNGDLEGGLHDSNQVGTGGVTIS